MSNSISMEFLGLNSYTPVIPSGPAAPYSAAGASDYTDKTSASKKSGGSNKTQLGGLDENMIKLLTEHGLESDVYSFLDKMEGAIMSAYDPITGRANYAAYKLILPQLSRIREEGKAYEEARKKMEANKSGDEIAVNNRGNVYIVDSTEGIVEKSLAELQGDEYILTNGELARARATNPGSAWNTDYTQAVANGVSTLEITKYILDSIDKLGKTETAQEYFQTSDGDLILGALALLEMIKANKGVAMKTDARTVSQQKLANYALGFLSNMLPSNMQTILQIRALRAGTDAITLMNSLIQSTLDSKITDNSNTKGSGTSSNGKASGVEMSSLMMYLSNTGGYQTKISLNPGLNVSMQVPARSFNQLLDAKGNLIPDGSLEAIVDKGLGSMSDLSKGVYVGNQWVSKSEFNQIYVQTGLTTRAYLPSTVDSHGVEHPDYDIIPEYENVCKLINKLGKNAKLEDIERIINNNPTISRYYEGIDANGNIIWDSNKFKPYMLLNVFANGDSSMFGSDSVLNVDTIGNWATEVSKQGEKKDYIKKRMQSVLGDNYRLDGDVYSTIVYIPLNDSMATVMSASGNNPKLYNNPSSSNVDDVRNIERKQNYNNAGNIKSNVI